MYLKKLFFCIAFLGLIAFKNNAQGIDAKYYAAWTHYPEGYYDNTDSAYRRLDTLMELTLNKDKTFTLTKKEKIEIYTPGKGYKRFKKTFRIIAGHYQTIGDSIELIDGLKAADSAQTRFYEFAVIRDHLNSLRNKSLLWDTRTNYSYHFVSDFNHNEMMWSMKRHWIPLFHYSATTKRTDTTYFWSNSPTCPDLHELPAPKLLYPGIPLKNNTYTFAGEIPPELQKNYEYNSHNRLTRYYYYRKGTTVYYNDITYTDTANEYNTTFASITDSKDHSVYVFQHDTKHCLISIEHFTAEKELIERYYLK
ncbi:MAG: hypothetical protein V4613_08305 [Bacteroidota bacterium]